MPTRPSYTLADRLEFFEEYDKTKNIKKSSESMNISLRTGQRWIAKKEYILKHYKHAIEKGYLIKFKTSKRLRIVEDFTTLTPIT